MANSSLLEIPELKLHKLLEQLAGQGVSQEDISRVSLYESNLEMVASSMKFLGTILNDIYGADEAIALSTVKKIDDAAILADIASSSARASVKVQAVTMIPRGHFCLYDIARLNPSAEVVTAAVARISSREQIRALACIVNSPWRQEILELALHTRFQDP